MRSIFNTLIIGVLIISSCQNSSIKDDSLSQEEYISLGIPSYDRIWTFKEISIAYAVLVQLKYDKPFSLPLKESNKSGALFKRMISLENMSFLEDDLLPLNEKATLSREFLKIHADWLDLYTNIRMKKQFYHKELVDVNIFGLNVTEKMLELANEINKSKVPEDVVMQSGFQSIQMLYLLNLRDVLDNQKYSSQYLIKDLEILSDSIFDSVIRNKGWMDSIATSNIKESLIVVIDSTSSDYIKNKYDALIETL